VGQAVFLDGRADEVGRIQGEWQRAALCERVERTLRRAHQLQNESVLRERAERFASVLENAAPHWIEEANGVANAAGIEPWQLLALNHLPPHFWGKDYVAPPLGGEILSEDLVDIYEAQGVEPGMGGGDCTAFFALGDASISGETLLHKNRDERDEVQSLYIKRIEGHFRFVGGGEIGNLGTAHAHSENFWAGANNTGSAVLPEEYVDCALGDSHVLRLLCERCASLDEIVPALEEWQSRGWVGGGGFEMGSIWILADAARALIIEATSKRLAHRRFDSQSGAMEVRTNHFLLPEMQEFCLAPHPASVRRLTRAQELWQTQSGIAGIAAAAELGRDRDGAPQAICRNPSDHLGSVTVSTSTATVSSHDDRRCQTHFRNCHPAYVPAVILTPLDRVCDSDLLSGAHNQHWRNFRGGA